MQKRQPTIHSTTTTTTTVSTRQGNGHPSTVQSPQVMVPAPVSNSNPNSFHMAAAAAAGGGGGKNGMGSEGNLSWWDGEMARQVSSAVSSAVMEQDRFGWGSARQDGSSNTPVSNSWDNPSQSFWADNAQSAMLARQDANGQLLQQQQAACDQPKVAPSTGTSTQQQQQQQQQWSTHNPSSTQNAQMQPRALLASDHVESTAVAAVAAVAGTAIYQPPLADLQDLKTLDFSNFFDESTSAAGSPPTSPSASAVVRPPKPTITSQPVYHQPKEEVPLPTTQSPEALPFTNNREVNEARWMQRYDELKEFQRAHGHCLVPLENNPDPTLAHWVKRQRCQNKIKRAGGHSTLTDQREILLNNLNFTWDFRVCSWGTRVQELMEFRRSHGHCNVPSRYAKRPLAVWVKTQRRQYKLLKEKKMSTLTEERYNELSSMGFVWISEKKGRGSRKL